MKHLGTLLKLAATLALFWFVFSRVDVVELAANLSPRHIVLALAAGVAVMSLQALVAAMRLKYCVRLLGRNFKMRQSWIACQYGGLFSHTPISFIGGDAMRIWHMAKTGLSLGESARAVVVDRALGFFGMMILVILSAPLLYRAIEDPKMWAGYLVLLGMGIGGTIVFFVLGRFASLSSRLPGVLRWVADLATVSRYLSGHPERAIKALVLGLSVTFLNVIAIWAIGMGYSTGVGFVTNFAAAPVVFLIAMIPISVAGWGLREGAFVLAFGLFGVPASTALTVSVTFGIAVLLAYSPAVLLLLLARRRGASGAKAAEFEPASSPPPGRS